LPFAADFALLLRNKNAGIIAMMTEESFIDFKCPHCGEVASFLRDSTGLVQECPNCAETVIIPVDGGQVGRSVPLPLNTPRLVLRRLQGIDWKDLSELFSDEDLFRYLDGRPLTEEEVTRWLEADSLVKLTTPDQPFCLGMELQQSNKLIGYVSLRFTDAQRHQAMLTILVNRHFQRQGFGTEALVGAKDFCLAALGLHRITAYCDSRDLAGRRLFEKSEFRREGEFVKDRFLNGEWISTVWYALLGDDYRTRNASKGIG
jgi:RimJ/RimL family protein N-acetyltransferase